jgi:phosphate transport system substrate-binding protein
MTYAFVNQPPGQSVSPLVKEFLRFVYSEEGQGLIEESHGFLPLTKEAAAKQALLLQ